MAQTIQIVPKFSFPYVETVVNDYTVVDDTSLDNANTEEPVVRYIFAFTSSKGIDNRFILKKSRANAVSAYGETNWKKYGQPLMQALNILESANTEVWCMRVMPENASYAHNIISGYYKGDTKEAVPVASERKFRIKFVQNHVTDELVTNLKVLKNYAQKLDGEATSGVYVDGEGYTQVPGLSTIWCAGRGKYGNNYRVRVGQDIYYEKDYGIKFYDFEILSTEAGLKKEANFVGAAVTSAKYNDTTLINDILDDQDDGRVPVFINFDEDGIEDIYEAYKTWVATLVPDLEEEYATKVSDYAVPEGMVEGLIPVTEEFRDKVTELRRIADLITNAASIPDLDQFDIIFGRNVAETTTIPFIYYPEKLTAEVDTEADTYVARDYTQSDVVYFDSVQGVKLYGGDDGYFAKPRTEVIDDENTKQWTLDEEIELCYNNAFSGVYDKRILAAKRIQLTALWDANYPLSTKHVLANLAELRNDGICYLDTGIRSSFGKNEVNQMIKDYSVFNDHKIDKNIHHYYVKESTSKKRVPVTISYLLTKKYAEHILNNGFHVPFVKDKCQLTGHVKDSLYPTVEEYESDLKELLCKNRFNYFETVDDNVYQRATQNTSQTDSSDLLEENNVVTLYEMKRIVERDISDRLYDFTDADARQRFRNVEVAKFSNWSNREVESFDIDFRMNKWEEERSIIHCYINVVFRGLQKRGILEIDINKRESREENLVTTLVTETE